MSDDLSTPGASEGSGRWILLVSALLAVFVGGGAFFYFSSENSSQFLLELREGHIVVRKGIFFPTGAIDYDGGATYAPIEVLSGVVSSEMAPGKGDLVVPRGPFADLAAVDKALYGLLLKLTREAIESGEAARLQNARELTARALKLPSVTDDLVDEILRYKGDLAIAEGQLALIEVKDLLGKARERMGRAVTRGTMLYKNPQGWVDWIDQALAQIASAEGARTPPAMSCPPSAAVPSLPPPPPPVAPSVPPPSGPAPAEATLPLPAEAPAAAPAAGPSPVAGTLVPAAPARPAPSVPVAPSPPPVAVPPPASPPASAPPALPQGSDPGTGLLFGNP